MPTRYRRIAVTEDPELADALARVAAFTADAPAATVVHDLAVKGAEAFLAERKEQEAAIERLIALSTGPEPLITPELLEEIDAAWGFPARNG
jgi:hypothetical protein